MLAISYPKTSFRASWFDNSVALWTALHLIKAADFLLY